jgi:hypothetical protein
LYSNSKGESAYIFLRTNKISTIKKIYEINYENFYKKIRTEYSSKSSANILTENSVQYLDGRVHKFLGWEHSEHEPIPSAVDKATQKKETY